MIAIREAWKAGLSGCEHWLRNIVTAGIVVKLCEANEKVLGKLDRAGILQALGSEHYHADFSVALSSYVEIDKSQG